MQNRVVEITSEGVHLSVARGFLLVAVKGEPAGRVAIDDIGALIIRGHGASLSVNLCARLAEANVPVVICGANQSPASIVWPVSGHFAQGLCMQAQAVASKPLRKRLWKQLIQAKITAQAGVLAACGEDSGDIASMARRVKTGDSANLESQAARRYWPRLMGGKFRRGRTAGGVNAALNYGYTVLRAATARAVLGAGLHPSLSIHHQSRGDALRLADDLMEPFRPWVDNRVREMANGDNPEIELDPGHKADLAGVLLMDFDSPAGASPMQTCIHRLAQSLTRVFAGETRQLDLPGPPTSMAVRINHRI